MSNINCRMLYQYLAKSRFSVYSVIRNCKKQENAAFRQSVTAWPEPMQIFVVLCNLNMSVDPITRTSTIETFKEIRRKLWFGRHISKLHPANCSYYPCKGSKPRVCYDACREFCSSALQNEYEHQVTVLHVCLYDLKVRHFFFFPRTLEMWLTHNQKELCRHN